MTFEISKKKFVFYGICFWFLGIVSTFSFLLYLNYLDENFSDTIQTKDIVSQPKINSDYVLPDYNSETFYGLKLDIDGEDPVHKLGLFHNVTRNSEDDLLLAMYYLTFSSQEKRADIYKKIFMISGQNGGQITQGQQLVLDLMMIKDNPDFVCKKQGESKCSMLKDMLDMMYENDTKEYIWNLKNMRDLRRRGAEGARGPGV